MSTETISLISSTVLSLSTGIISGLYAGLVVARSQRFADPRSQAKKVVLEIDYAWEGDHMIFRGREETPEFSLIASELLSLKHRAAGELILRLGPEIYASIQNAKMGRINFSTFNDQYLSWQNTIYSIAPNPWRILHLWAGL